MASKHETLVLFNEGHSPSEIARRRDRTVSTIVQHLRMLLGDGAITPVDVFLSFGPKARATLDKLRSDLGEDHRDLVWKAVKHGFDWHEARLYYDLCASSALRGAIYVYIADIELELHTLVKERLVQQFGAAQDAWWRKGVPTSVRKACVQAREDDAEPVDDPYCYTNFIHLAEIIDSNWAVFHPVFERSLLKDKKILMSWLRHLNSVRNSIMHPVKRKSLDAHQLQALKLFASYFDLLGRAATLALQPPGGTGISPGGNSASEGGAVSG